MVRSVAGLLARVGQDVTIEPYQGVSAAGAETYGAAVTVRAYVEHGIRLARGGRNMMTSEGEASSRAWVELDTDAPVGSRVTVRGTAYIVVEHLRFDGGATSAPSHTELRLR